jgi:FAD/FMN-containing dehydrogenase
MAVVTRVEPRQAGPGPRATGSPVNVVALGKQLSARVKGEVRFDEASRHLYANDASLYRQVPIGVVIPEDADDVLGTLEVCRRFRAPIVARGCGTGLAGQSVSVAVMIDFSKYMNRILELDPSGGSPGSSPA